MADDVQTSAARARTRREFFVGLYESGATMTEIGAGYGISTERVRQLLLRARPDWRISLERRNRTADPVKLMQALRRPEAMTWHAVAKLSGMGQSTLEVLVGEMGMWRVVERLFRMRIRKYEREKDKTERAFVVAELQRLTRENGMPVSSKFLLREHGALYRIARNRFGSIASARAAAGFDESLCNMMGRHLRKECRRVSA